MVRVCVCVYVCMHMSYCIDSIHLAKSYKWHFICLPSSVRAITIITVLKRQMFATIGLCILFDNIFSVHLLLMHFWANFVKHSAWMKIMPIKYKTICHHDSRCVYEYILTTELP